MKKKKSKNLGRPPFFSTFLSLVKKATLNMNSFPGRLLTSSKLDGGLGIISISDAAHERKRKVLLQLVNRGGAEGIAIQGLLGRAMRTSGHGGVGSSGSHAWESLEDSGSINSLIVKLRALGLRLRVGGSAEESQEFAAMDENLTEEREIKQEGNSTEIGDNHGRFITIEGLTGLASRGPVARDLSI